MDHDGMVGLALIIILLGGPVVLGMIGWIQCRGERPASDKLVSRRLMLLSMLLYTLAFNLTFFLQELFLVIPKALTPGLQPTLFHNNHNWAGTHQLERLLQGTGALTILISGIIFAWLAKRGVGRTQAMRLFVLWMAYHGLFQSLPQFATAPVAPGSDTGQALDWFGLGVTNERLIAAVGVAAIIVSGLFMARRFLEFGGALKSGKSRSKFVFCAAVLPAVLAIPILIAFRVPREWVEVIMPTIAVPLIGLSWMQASAWRMHSVRPVPVTESLSLRAPLGLVLLLLLFFQLILRPGIPF